MAASRLIQTRIPPALFQTLSKKAKAEGLSVAAFLRRLVILHVEKAQTAQEKN
jgi:hypothetical protein